MISDWSNTVPAHFRKSFASDHKDAVRGELKLPESLQFQLPHRQEGSWMSELKVYWPESGSIPEEAEIASSGDSGEPEIYSFVEWVERLRSPALNSSALRARRLHVNQSCPECHRASVLPLMLNDGRLDGAGRLVPGSATLVGFRCEQCCSEWPA